MNPCVCPPGTKVCQRASCGCMKIIYHSESNLDLSQTEKQVRDRLERFVSVKKIQCYSFTGGKAEQDTRAQTKQGKQALSQTTLSAT